jgi:hypothetical protein
VPHICGEDLHPHGPVLQAVVTETAAYLDEYRDSQEQDQEGHSSSCEDLTCKSESEDEEEGDDEQEGGGLEDLLWPPELLATAKRYGREKRTKRVGREALAQVGRMDKLMRGESDRAHYRGPWWGGGGGPLGRAIGTAGPLQEHVEEVNHWGREPLRPASVDPRWQVLKATKAPGYQVHCLGGAGMTMGQAWMVQERLGGMEGGFGWEHLYQT